MILNDITPEQLYFQTIPLEGTSLGEWSASYLVVCLGYYGGDLRVLDSGLTYSGLVDDDMIDDLNSIEGQPVPYSDTPKSIRNEYTTPKGEVLIEAPGTWLRNYRMGAA